jgi:hypothetical protein
LTNEVGGGPRRRSAQTDAASVDPDLRGRTYAIPFERVWTAALHLAGGGVNGWTLLHADDLAGVIEAEAPSPPLSGARADVRVRISLDRDGQTRVDAESTSRTTGPDFGANRRRLSRFMSLLDNRVNARDGQILDSRPVEVDSSSQP